MEDSKYDLLEETIEFIAKLTRGIDPVCNNKLSEDSIINNNIYKMSLKNAVGLLEILKKNHHKIEPVDDKRIKLPFCMTADERDRITLFEEPISISKLVYQMNQFVSDSSMKKLKATQVTNWLMYMGYLQEDSNGFTSHKQCTEKANEIGIATSERINEYNQSYYVNLYDQNAQEYIIENAKLIVEYQNE